ncbi:MAG: hypothetical protein WDM86_15435 [Rhizomicrobium sp.]
MKLHSAMMRGLHVNRIELDEIWAFVGKKQRLVTHDDSDMVGDQYTFIALADSAKAIITYRTGKRTAINTQDFADDLRARVIGSPEISTDGFNASVVYPPCLWRERCAWRGRKALRSKRLPRSRAPLFAGSGNDGKVSCGTGRS